MLLCTGTTSTKGKRYYATEDDDLRSPLAAGWRRETTIREYTKSGIRGEVVYVAPCGKRFKQYPDIIRVSTGEIEGGVLHQQTTITIIKYLAIYCMLSWFTNMQRHGNVFVQFNINIIYK